MLECNRNQPLVAHQGSIPIAFCSMSILSQSALSLHPCPVLFLCLATLPRDRSITTSPWYWVVVVRGGAYDWRLLIWRGCGRDVMSQLASVTLLGKWPSRLFHSPLAKTCDQTPVSVEPDASETWSGYLLQLSGTQCSGKARRLNSSLTTH